MGLKKQNYHKKFSFTAQKYQTSFFFLYKKLISSIFSFFFYDYNNTESRKKCISGDRKMLIPLKVFDP